MEKHWYRIHITECPVCGGGDTGRERVYGDKPENPYEFHSYYDYCLE